MSVIRVSSADRKELAKCCAHILDCWRGYSDPDAGIFAFTESTPHNTITPISRKRDGAYECDLVLRNNRTSDERPLGIFHPNPSLHHIKKENIGLIEVMGLAVLPARLAIEIELIEDAILNGKNASENEKIASHSEWIDEIKAKHRDITSENIRSVLEYEIGKVFLEVLCDAGVYKRDEDGMNAFIKFTKGL
jgi:UDPglucose--hexose-1-phosphate uridylyltransferase